MPSVASKAHNRDCFYCHTPGHLIAACPVLKNKEAKSIKTPVGVGLIKSASQLNVCSDIQQKPKVDVDPQFLPFISQGFVSLTGKEKDKVPITILRDTDAYHSFIRICAAFIKANILWFRYSCVGNKNEHNQSPFAYGAPMFTISFRTR